MIIFDLICEHDHRFDGWFQNTQDFDSQSERGMLVCPRCASASIRKIPSAVSISGMRGEKAAVRDVQEDKSQQTLSVPAPSNTHLMGLYRQLSQAMIAISEDVGSSFAEEARRIHYQETPERPIRGQATNEEFESLKEEGIAVMRLPMVKEEDLN